MYKQLCNSIQILCQKTKWLEQESFIKKQFSCPTYYCFSPLLPVPELCHSFQGMSSLITCSATQVCVLRYYVYINKSVVIPYKCWINCSVSIYLVHIDLQLTQCLAPLLALFGERVTTQYLRYSTTYLESLIFACAPLGILTAVTSAIRIGGDRRLKAMIGRADESDAVAEIELAR